MSLFALAAAAALQASPTPAPVVVQCRFNRLPPMVLTFAGGRAGTLEIDGRPAIPLTVGSGLSTARYGDLGFTFSLRRPASVTVDLPDGSTSTRAGRCSSSLPPR